MLGGRFCTAASTTSCAFGGKNASGSSPPHAATNYKTMCHTPNTSSKAVKHTSCTSGSFFIILKAMSITFDAAAKRAYLPHLFATKPTAN